MDEQQKIERLEDLTISYRDAILEIAEGSADIDFPVWDVLHDMGLVDYDADEMVDVLTDAGQALVADYQQCQSDTRTPAEIAEYEAVQEKMTGETMQDKPTYERLEAENARLRAALDNLLTALDNQFDGANPKKFPPGTFEYALDNERIEAAKALKK